MESLIDNLNFSWNILKVALGLGFVIFIHELGHFLLAKWNGVKVEKFSIGFGPTLASFRRGVGVRVGKGSRPAGPEDPPSYGETEYILAALPLGGYVKMLGQSDDGNPSEAAQSADPRAYNNKSVWGRMGIITAGVIMNVLLGIACFAATMVGGVLPGSPAYEAGLRAGDEIVAIDGRRQVAFKQLLHKVSLSAKGQQVHFAVRRPGVDKELDLAIEPRREGDVIPTIGLYSASSLELATEIPFQATPGMVVDKARPFAGFQGGDTVVAVGPEGGPSEPVADYNDFLRKADALRGQPIAVVVEHADPDKDKLDPKTTAREPAARHPVTVPVHSFVDFGFRLTPGPITSTRPDSPASKPGLRPGDRIMAVDGDKD